MKEQKGEEEAKMKENQRLADENFGSSRSRILMIIDIRLIMMMILKVLMITCSRDFLQEARSSSLGWWAPP